MSAFRVFSPVIALAAFAVGSAIPMGATQAAPMTAASMTNAAMSIDENSSLPLHRVRRGWGGVEIYIGPSYGYYDGGRYYDDDYYYRPRRSYYYSDGYDRPYRRHGYRWTQERFEHPLGRR